MAYNYMTLTKILKKIWIITSSFLNYYRNNFKCVGFLYMCSCSDTGNMQLLYNTPGGYLVHVLFSQFVFFPINGPGFRKTPVKLW